MMRCGHRYKCDCFVSLFRSGAKASIDTFVQHLMFSEQFSLIFTTANDNGATNKSPKVLLHREALLNTTISKTSVLILSIYIVYNSVVTSQKLFHVGRAPIVANFFDLLQHRLHKLRAWMYIITVEVVNATSVCELHVATI